MKNKIILCLLTWMLPCKYITAQNPYAQFGSKVTELTAKIDTSYQIIYNPNPTAEINKIGVDYKNQKVDFYGINNAIVKILFISPDVFLHWISPDPKAKDYSGWSPYNFVENNPIKNTDPTGAGVNDEFDPDGNKISNLGGDKIDFYHQKNGDTKIVDRKTGASNTIFGGESLIKGYTLRDKNTNWEQITYEFLTGTGPTNSLFADFDNSNEGAFGSLHSSFSSYSTPARKESLNSPLPKDKIIMDYSNANPIVAQDMWEQMWGRADVSYYKLGDETLFLMTDSKSATSLSYRMSSDWERSSNQVMGNTYQTYIWVESNEDIQNKVVESQNQVFMQYDELK